LRSARATVVVPARDIAKAKAALTDVADVGVEKVDLLDPRSIDAFVQRFVRLHDKLNILVNNAGIMALH
jgi:NAD(P)-dependent dehydrogenase (short-subunit alcohol dehydrogenase family)